MCPGRTHKTYFRISVIPTTHVEGQAHSTYPWGWFSGFDADPVNLGSHLGRSVSWMEGTTVYGLYHRIVRIFPSIHKTCEIYTKQSINTGTSHHNVHLNEDSLVALLQILPNLDPHLWWSMAWMEDISVYGLLHRLVRPMTRIHNTCGSVCNPSIATGTSYHIPHLTMIEMSDGYSWPRMQIRKVC